MKATPQPIVLAMNSRMECHAYGPFPTEQEADLWKEAQDRDSANAEWQYVLIPLMPAHVRVSRPVR
jgi:hypothetical protein